MVAQVFLRPLHTDLKSYSQATTHILRYVRCFPFAYLANGWTYRNLATKTYFKDASEKVQNLEDRQVLLLSSTISALVSTITLTGLSILGFKSSLIPFFCGVSFIGISILIKKLRFSGLSQEIAAAQSAQLKPTPPSSNSAQFAVGTCSIGECNGKLITAWEEKGCCYISIDVKNSVLDGSQEQFLNGFKSPSDQIKAPIKQGVVQYQLRDNLPAIEQAKFWILIDQMQDTGNRFSSDWPISIAIRWFVQASLEGNSEAKKWIQEALESPFKGNPVLKASFHTYAPFLKLGIVGEKGLQKDDIETLKRYLEKGFSYRIEGYPADSSYGRSYTAYILGDPFIAQKVQQHTHFDPTDYLKTQLESKMADCKQETVASIEWIQEMFNAKAFPLAACYQSKAKEAVWSALNGCSFEIFWNIGTKREKEESFREVLRTQLKTILKDDTLKIGFQSSSWFHNEVLIFPGKDISNQIPFNQFFHKEYRRQFNELVISKNCLVITRTNWKQFLQLIAQG